MAKGLKSDLFDITNDTTESIEMDNPFVNKEEVLSDDEALIEDILNLDTDVEVLADQLGSLFLESGDYMWDSSPYVRVSFVTNDTDSNDISSKRGQPLGRCMLNISGIVVSVKTGRKGRFNFTCSPDTRKVNGEADFPTKNYAMWAQHFFKKYERNVKNPAETKAFIHSGGYVMYITKGKSGGNFLNQIKNSA